MRPPSRTRALVLAVALLLGAAPAAASARAFDVGVGDSAQYPAEESAPLRAAAYRLVVDPAVPLSTYDAQIASHRAVGQLPQIVVGGIGTIHHTSADGVVATAVAAARRWAPVYSVSVVNEPNESGMPVCQYARTYLAAYPALKAAGVRRVLFGEWSPNNVLAWQHAELTHCRHTSRRLRGRIDAVAWHAYGNTAIDLGPKLSAMTARLAGRRPRLYVTEAGYVLRYRDYHVRAGTADAGGLRYWRHALAVARHRLSEIVAWDLRARPGGKWDSSLIDVAGRPRPAFDLIAGR